MSEPDPTRPNTAKQVAVDAFEELSAIEQKHLRALAIVVEFMGGEDARRYIEAQKLTQAQELGLWSLLPSAVRTSLQRAARAPRPPSDEREPPQDDSMFDHLGDQS